MDPNAAKPRMRLAVTAGDPNGVGPEVALKCVSDPRLLRYVEPVLVGPRGVLERHRTDLGLQDVALHTISLPGETVPVGAVAVLDPDPALTPAVEYGAITAAAGRAAMRAVETAVRGCVEGSFDAMVTAPISKEAISLAGYDAPGHTEFIAGLTGGRPLMMLVSDRLRVALVTAHVPLRAVPEAVTQGLVKQRIADLSQSLRRDFGIERPRVAVLGLNPHAGDGGVLGSEERDVIAPAVRAACAEGLHAFGPYPADGFFASRGFAEVDAVLAMYHDQGLVPFKTLAFESGVNFTAGLPIVRTSPDHGTAYDIAGLGRASASSMRAAVYLAIDVARRRRAVTEGHQG